MTTTLEETCKTGFTFLEALIALVVLTIMVSVVLETQIITIKKEQYARSARFVRHEINRITTGARLGFILTNVNNNESLSDCDISAMPYIIKDGTGLTEAIEWQITPKNRPSTKTVIYTRSFPLEPISAGSSRNK